MNDLDHLVSMASAEFHAAPTPAELENAKARFLGKSGRVTELLKSLASLSVDEKKSRGAEINQAKSRIEAALQARRDALQRLNAGHFVDGDRAVSVIDTGRL